MQHDVGLACQPKEWLVPRLVMHKYLMPSAQINEGSCNEIISNLTRQSKV